MNSYSLESMKGAQSVKRGRISVRLGQIAFKWKQFAFWKHWGIRWKCPNWSSLKPPFPIWHELWNFIRTYRYINNVAIDITPKLSLSFDFEWLSKTAYFHPGICYNRNRFDYILNLRKLPLTLGKCRPLSLQISSHTANTLFGNLFCLAQLRSPQRGREVLQISLKSSPSLLFWVP